MKYLLTLLAAIVLFASCSTDFDIAADYEEVTVVYALLDPTQPVQFIRIQKGYLDEDKSALDLALESDSIYYNPETMKVELEIVSSGQRFTLQDTLLNKDDGIFASNNNRLYYFDQPLQTNQTYRLHIENLQTGHIVTAETPIIQDFNTIFPPNDVNSDYDINLVAKDVAGNPRFVNTAWQSAVNGKVYELSLRFHYIVFRNGTSNPGDTTFIDWPVFRNETSATTAGGEGMAYEYDGRSLLTFLANNLEAHPDSIRKVLDRPIEYRYTVGGEVLWDYIRVNTQAQTGITALEAQPDYTNINGGLGIFSTRTRKFRPEVGLRDQTLDSLACGFETAPLQFIVGVPTSCN